MYLLLAIRGVIEQIPAAFWGVVFGSFFSILGVWLSNRASEKRLRAQFDHETRQKAREREIALKKEIYLGAVATLALGIRMIGNLSNVYATDAEVLKPGREEGSAVAKVAVVASAETVRAFANLNDGIRASFLTLYPRRVELLVEKNSIDTLDQVIEKTGKEQDHVLEQMKQRNLAGITDGVAWRVLNSSFEFEGKRRDEWIEKRKNQYKTLTAGQLKFGRECIKATSDLSARFVPVFIALRSELEMPLEAAVLAQAMQDSPEVQVAYEGAVRKFEGMAGLIEGTLVVSDTGSRVLEAHNS